MGKVTATAERTIDAPADRVRGLVADYSEARPKILTEQYRDYEVTEGGKGAGTVAKWKLQATSKRVRDVAATVTEPEPGTLVETDANSSMVTTWTVREAGDGGKRSLVRVETSWDGAGGIGGFFEKTFAPGGLKRIYDGVLAKLEEQARVSS
ncbi:polyketide cyclase [Prauserella marina]|uniref:Polyketide cyclase / dehydrase and lipid transport n=1 Tax=Prauserella marina TaxID=530584 RepID=A0A222VJ24_9PSEU|nr:SRPBCC family protein [Prauserella marina]ASR33929.1 polyketide cyclase [Prauserella marina]PWV82527.1 polyketide cyclase/dehydrase/lipid transport protein [Prauserella marina]SDC71292.1 Polyketide cyclase / dehydrase and lipid transport [Prauserella marina]